MLDSQTVDKMLEAAQTECFKAGVKIGDHPTGLEIRLSESPADLKMIQENIVNIISLVVADIGCDVDSTDTMLLLTDAFAVGSIAAGFKGQPIPVDINARFAQARKDIIQEFRAAKEVQP